MPLGIGYNQQQQEDPNKKKQNDPLGFLTAMAGPTGGGGGIPDQWAPTINPTQVVSAGTIRDTSGLQFNPKYAQMVNNLDRGVYDLQLQQHQQKVNAQAANQQASLKAAEMQEQARQALIERMAGTGRLRSSTTARNTSELEGQYTQYQQQLANDLAGRLSQAEAGFVQGVNQIAAQKEALFGQQQQEEEALRLQQQLAEAERQAREQQAAQQAAIIAQQQQQFQAQMAQQQAMLAAISARPISGGGGGGAVPAAPANDGRTFTNEELEQTYRNATAAGQGHRDRSMQAIEHWFQTDPVWAQIARNTASKYGRANDQASMTDFFYNPYNWVPGLSQGNWPVGVL